MPRKILPVFAVLCCCFLAACSKPPEKEKAPAPVQVTAVTQATIRRIVDGDGALFPRDQASLMPKIAAPVQKFYVNRGDHVKQGQLLAVLENRDLIALPRRAKARWNRPNRICARQKAPPFPNRWSRRRSIWNPPARRATTPRKFWKAAQQLFKQGALAGRLVDESQRCLFPGRQPVSRRRRSI